MHLSYRTRQFYRRLFRVILALVLVALLVLLGWVLWVRRYIIYTNAGARIDFSLTQDWAAGVTGQGRPVIMMPEIVYPDADDPVGGGDSGGDTEVELPSARFEGFYLTVDDLLDNLDGVLEDIMALPEGTPVMVDVMGYWGYFYYSTQVGATTSTSFHMATMDAFFEAINSRGLYTIARLPAFRNYEYAMNHFSCGLQIGAGYLYADDKNAYWLDPANDTVLTYLVDISRELRDMGFDEVSFLYFTFPDADNLLYTGDRQEALAKAAQTLVTACANDQFAISFITTDTAFVLPEGNCRLYLQDVSAFDVEDILAAMDPATVERVVFFTTSNDTRFQRCGTIKPISMALFRA